MSDLSVVLNQLPVVLETLMSLWNALSTCSHEFTTGSEYSNFASRMSCILIVMNQLPVVNILTLPLESRLPVGMNHLPVVNNLI